MDFANELYQIMKEEELNQTDIAKRTKISRVTIGRYLSRKRSPNIRIANHILSCLGYELVIKKKEKRGTENDI